MRKLYIKYGFILKSFNFISNSDNFQIISLKLPGKDLNSVTKLKGKFKVLRCSYVSYL